MKVNKIRKIKARQPEYKGEYAPQEIKLKGHWKFTLTDIITGAVRIFEYDNIIPTVARTALATAFISGSPTSVLVNKVALGTGVTAPANGDTTLETETYRNNVASLTSASNIAYLTGFFTATETTGTYREAGLFAGGTAAANTGTLISRVAINITKANTETLTCDWTMTIN